MKTVLKPIFELITGEYTLFDNILYNYVAMAVIGLIAFAIAWSVVGRLYADGMIDGRGIGSLIHWVIRLVVFIVVFYVFSLVLWIGRVMLTLPWWAAILIVLAVIAVIVLIMRRRNY